MVAMGCGLTLARAPAAAVATNEASANAVLLVRGETEMSAGTLAWRVVRDVAEPGQNAPFERRALGFAIASAPFTSLLLTDEATGSASRLAPGEASFVREGTMQRRETLAGGAQAYLRIGLVTADAATDAGGDRLLFPGPAFTVPSGETTLALYRVNLEPGDMVPLPATLGETLVLVEQGDIELVNGTGTHETLRTIISSDTFYAIRSAAPGSTLIGARAATSVLFATII
ncbi:MAG: hypothetical protein U0031_07170 [Thermomicrobiales bacterium]